MEGAVRSGGTITPSTGCASQPLPGARGAFPHAPGTVLLPQMCVARLGAAVLRPRPLRMPEVTHALRPAASVVTPCSRG